MTKAYEEKMWAIYNPEFGLYVDTAHTRREMIAKHCIALGEDWRECERRGDKAVKVLMTYTIEHK